MKNFCDITTRNELADFLNIPIQKLTYVLYKNKVDSYYISFEIPKKTGGIRHIDAPVGDLKSIQKKLSAALWEYQKTIWETNKIRPNISHAFEKDKSIITNAKVHRNKRFLLNIDLEDFFNSIHFGRVRGFFQKNKHFKLSKEVSTIIAQLACYNKHLPQGAPCSPIITNMICQTLDIKLLKLAKKYKLDYTRYADDLSFSTNDKSFLEVQIEFSAELLKEIKCSGFKINDKKTRLQFKDSKQVVTGLIVNKKLNVDHAYYKKTKAMAHSLYSNGYYKIENTIGTINQLEGRFAFINQLDKYNNHINKASKSIYRKINGREKEYQRFLFYKYFFNNDKPIIVTEGKTDVVYLKSALKNHYTDYPNLIKKISNNKFEFKISFLRKTKRLNYFFGISQDGADAMKNLYNFFSPVIGEKMFFPDYLSYFNRIGFTSFKNPVILVFDNEIQNKNKPLCNFTNHIKLEEKQKKILFDELSIKLFTNGNLFLVTNELIGEKQECEIEDLFNTETLAHQIQGKTFSPKDKFDISKHYGKEIFSQYISDNYETIDFSGFTGILNRINKIIEL